MRDTLELTSTEGLKDFPSLRYSVFRVSRKPRFGLLRLDGAARLVVAGLHVDLRAWQRGARVRRRLLQGEVGVYLVAGSCMVLERSVWRTWQQMRGAELQRVLDVVMRDVRLVREGV